MRVTFLEEYSGSGFHHCAGATQELPDDEAQKLIKTKRARVADPLPEEGDIETADGDQGEENASADPVKKKR